MKNNKKFYFSFLLMFILVFAFTPMFKTVFSLQSNIKITKNVEGNNINASKEFKFTIKINIPGANESPDEYNYEKSDGTTGKIKSSQTFKLKHGENIVIKDIPNGYGVVVSEEDYTSEGYIAKDGKDKDATIGQQSQIDFVNIKNTDDIKITKNVEGNNINTSKEFEFTIKINIPGANESPAEYNYEKSDGATGKIKSSQTFKLKHGENILIKDIPNGYGVVVSEKDYTSEGYIAKDGKDKDGSIGQTKQIDFVNIKNTDDIKITKNVEGNNADKTKEFEFTIKINIPGANESPTEYNYEKSDGTTGKIKSSQTFKLKHGENIVIKGIPNGYGVVVSEEDYTSEGYTAKNGKDKDATIGQQPQIDFVNSKEDSGSSSPTYGKLTIKKIVSGNFADLTKKFRFTIKIGSDPTRTFYYQGENIPSGTIKSGDTISLAHNESITIYELETDLSYEVVEDDYSSDGYTTKADRDKGLIIDGEITALFTNTKDVSDDKDKQDKDNKDKQDKDKQDKDDKDKQDKDKQDKDDKDKQDKDDKGKQDKDDKGKQGGDDSNKNENETEINIDEETVPKGTNPKEPKIPDPIKTNKKKLPQTGNSDNKILFLGGLFALILGIKLRKNKK